MDNWTLFLDRDGVINQRIVGGYVRHWDEFEFLEGVLEAMPIFREYFARTVVVTNQQGIAKGLMTEQDLHAVHKAMLKTIEAAEGQIEKVYYCPLHERENPHCRKPNPGMAEQAQTDFPQIDFNHSVMVGDSITDITFGKQLGMTTVLLETKVDIDQQKLAKIEAQIDYRFPSLWQLSQALDQILV